MPSRGPNGKQLTGSAKAKRKRLREEAERLAADAGFEARALAEIAAVGALPEDARQAPSWLLRMQACLAAIAIRNPATPLSSRIEQASRILAAANKTTDSAKLRAELDELLDLLHQRSTGVRTDEENRQ
jgi:hypothetical protein